LVNQLADNPKDLFRAWEALEDPPGEVVYGLVPMVGLFSWRDRQIIKHEFQERQCGMYVTTWRPATNGELRAIDRAAETNTLQIEARKQTGALGVYALDDPGARTRIYHQARGRWGVIPVDKPVVVKKRKARQQKPELTFTGDRVVLTDPATGETIGA
jgi:hypothetical protein